MPELPDVTVYIEVLEEKLRGAILDDVVLHSPFLLRSVSPPLSSAKGKRIRGFRRMGKRIVFVLDDDADDTQLFLVVHLMVAGRFQWVKASAKPSRITQATFVTNKGTVQFTEAGTKRRASLHVVKGEDELKEHERGGLEPLTATLPEFVEAFRRERHTLKRTLTDPRLFSGIGNAYSDEILFDARVSPFLLSTNVDDEMLTRLFNSMKSVLTRFTDAIRTEAAGEIPKKVTAFRDDMRVHGKYGTPCHVCGQKIQRIVHAENESNYCAACQNAGRLFADRALSRLLKDDWPRSLDELEAMKSVHRDRLRGDAPASTNAVSPVGSKAAPSKKRSPRK